MKQKACSLLHTLGGQKSKKIATWMVVGRRQQIKKKSPKKDHCPGTKFIYAYSPPEKDQADLVHLQT